MRMSQNYRGPAREFAEGDKNFDLMLERACMFLSYCSLWGGQGGDTDYLEGAGQQDKLGMARAMAIAIEANPASPEKNEGITEQFLTLIKARHPSDEIVINSVTQVIGGYLLAVSFTSYGEMWKGKSLLEEAIFIVEEDHGPNQGNLSIGWTHKTYEHHDDVN